MAEKIQGGGGHGGPDPDGSYEEIVYDRLDVGSTRDRDGRVTHYTHDGARRLTGILDPANRLIQLAWWQGGGWRAVYGIQPYDLLVCSSLLYPARCLYRLIEYDAV